MSRFCSPFVDKGTHHSLVDDRLIRQLVRLTVEAQIALGMQLPHENHDHLLLRVNGKSGIKEASPVVFSGGSKFSQRCFHAINSEAESEALVGAHFSNWSWVINSTDLRL